MNKTFRTSRYKKVVRKIMDTNDIKRDNFFRTF
jgi:hypothetical protein